MAIVYKTVFISCIQSCINLTENYFLLKKSHSLIYHVYHVFVYVCAFTCFFMFCVYVYLYVCVGVCLFCVCVCACAVGQQNSSPSSYTRISRVLVHKLLFSPVLIISLNCIAAQVFQSSLVRVACLFFFFNFQWFTVFLALPIVEGKLESHGMTKGPCR